MKITKHQMGGVRIFGRKWALSIYRTRRSHRGFAWSIGGYPSLTILGVQFFMTMRP